MTTQVDTLLLLALPASGKSEVRRYLANLSPAECRDDFHMGPTVQLDDFPYVHLMRRIDEELVKLGRRGVYFQAGDRPFADAWDWGTLIQLLNEDYDDLLALRRIEAESAAHWLFERFDRAARLAGAAPKLRDLPDGLLKDLAKRMEAEARARLDEQNANLPDTLQGKTIVLEFARGGADGSRLPLKAPFGYQHSLAQLSPTILERSAILYVWVTPEESRRKNEARTDPNDPGSILHHGVPIAVMLGDYGCDDMEWLIEHSGTPGHVKVQAHERSFLLKVGRFDNRVDKTSFIRNPKEQWAPADVQAVHQGLKSALDQLVA